MKRSRVLSLVNLTVVMLLPVCNSILPATEITAMTDAIATPTSVENGAWKTYHNPQAAFTAEYPADWTVSEQAGADGSIVTTFSPIDGGAGIMVIVQNGDFAGGNSDIPNTRCEQVIVGGVSGMRCFDTINFATSTVVVSNGKTFTIASLGKRLDESIYSRFLSGFQIIK